MSDKLMVFALLLFCVGVVVGSPLEAAQHELTWTEFVDVMETVPQKGRYDFIKKHYMKGYDLLRHAHPEASDEDSQLAIGIFKLVSQDPTKTHKPFMDILTRREQICFPLPIGCIDSGDAGLRPS